MDKNLLYSLPKDILVELICKQFSGLSVEQLGDIYTSRCSAEMEKYSDILDEKYNVDRVSIDYMKPNIYLKDGDFFLDIDIYDYIILSDEDEIHYGDNTKMIKGIRSMLRSQLYSNENIDNIIMIIEMIITTHEKRIQTKKIIRNNF